MGGLILNVCRRQTRGRSQEEIDSQLLQRSIEILHSLIFGFSSIPRQKLAQLALKRKGTEDLFPEMQPVSKTRLHGKQADAQLDLPPMTFRKTGAHGLLPVIHASIYCLYEPVVLLITMVMLPVSVVTICRPMEVPLRYLSSTRLARWQNLT